MKRQIIKTRPQRPYLVARAVLIVAACILIAVLAYVWWSHGHVHAGAVSITHTVQDLAVASMNPRSPVNLS